MALHIGKIIIGTKGSYKLLSALKAPTVYKAQVLSGLYKPQKWAVVKSAVADLEHTALKREYHNYQLPDIASNPHIRALYDVAGSFQADRTQKLTATDDPSCLVFEWMETNLQSLPSQPYRENSKLPQSISRSVLSALCVLRKLGAIHTDVSPNNVFLSDIDTSSPIVKLGDLGTMTKEGYNKIRIQSLECRAPEVWQGLGCFHASDIWSVGVTLAHWLFGKPIFGASDKIIEGYIDAWCIAKIHKLIGPMPIESCADIEQYKEHFELGEQLALMDMGPDPEHGALVKVGSLREELETISEPSVPEALLDFIYHLLVIDTARRPTANDALQHRYLWSDF